MSTWVIFQLYGPLASWGDVAVGEIRPSALHPTRSAVLGLVAAALGFDRGDAARHEALQASYRVAVELRRQGNSTWDYHTAQVAGSTSLRKAEKAGHPARTRRQRLALSGLNTILSRREYREDSYLRVVLWPTEADPTPMPTEIVDALRRPVFPLYLGRRACPPALPLDPKVIEAPDLARALADCPPCLPPELEPLLATDPGEARLHWEAEIPSGVPAHQILDVRDDRRGCSRSFGRRSLHVAFIGPEA